MPRLVAIGDSLTQGVQSGTVSRTEFSYPALIAEAMGLDVPKDFRVPTFPDVGLPLDIEWLLHSMHRNLGESINWFEWRFQVPFLLANRLDRIEDLYERGSGSQRTEYNGVYHNLAVSSFRVFDSFKVHDDYCSRQINSNEKSIEDNFLGFPPAPMYRIAQRVLNPGGREDRQKWTQICNLQHLHENEGGVENLILFLGANDCLGTVKDLRINEMEGDVPKDPEERRDYNLSSESAFKKDYEDMVRKISKAIAPREGLPKTKVFVGTIPHVTIAPIIRGIGSRLPDDPKYFSHYSRFFVNDDDFDRKDRHLTGENAKYIDKRIDKFNCLIDKIIQDVPEHGDWHLVDICRLLDDLAVRRSDNPDDSSKPLRELLSDVPDHPLLGLGRIPNVHLFESYNSEWRGGGLFSLDCFHPTTIGYGLIAEAFLQRMKEEGVNIAPPYGSEEDQEQSNWNRLNWRSLIAQDPLIQDPPVLWDDALKAARAHPRLSRLICRVSP